MSGHGKRPTERSALTNWRRQGEGLVRTRKNTNRAKHTHKLETVERGTCQEMENNQRSRCTHFLKTASGGTCQDMERNRPTEAHSLSGDGRGRDLSGDGKKPAEQGALTSWRRQGEGLVRTRKETNRAKHTHFLERVERGTCQEMKKKPTIEVHSLPEDSIGRNLSRHGYKPTDRGTLTIWRRQGEGLVRRWKETGRPRRTHILETAGGGTCRDMERNRPTGAHSHSGDGIRGGLVRTRKKTNQAKRTHQLETGREGTFRTEKETD